MHIATPPHSHLLLARKAIDAGAHVLVEKPLTLRYPDSRALVEHAEHAGRMVCVGYGYHFDPPAQTLRALIRDEQLGDIVHLEAFYGYNLDGPFGAAMLGDKDHWIHSMPGKLLQNTLDHPISEDHRVSAGRAPDDRRNGHGEAPRTLRRRPRRPGR